MSAGPGQPQFSDPFEAVKNTYSTTASVQYMGVAGHVAVVADYLHTFPSEVRYMWLAPLTVPKVLFFLLRYYLLFHRIPAIFLAMPTTHSPEVCHAALSWALSSCFFIVAASEAILFIRVYAFSGRNERLGVYLIVQFIAIHGTGIALLVLFLKSAKYIDFPLPNLPCTPVEANPNLLSGIFATFLVSLFIVMVIMVYAAYQKHRNFRAKNNLMAMFYRDGIFYFIILSVLAAANIIVTLTPSAGGVRLVLTQADVDLHGILSTRMLLHLRRWAERETGASLSGRSTDPIEYSTNGTSSGGSGMPLRYEKF